MGYARHVGAKMRVLVFAALIPLSMSAATAQQNVEWTISHSGGSVIEIPVFMTEGWVRALMSRGEEMGTAFEPELFPIQLRQYRTTYSGRPIDYLEDALGSTATEVTYEFDRIGLGAMSGYTDNDEIFYGMCKTVGGPVVCFDMHWPKEMQSMMAPVVERIAAGFRDGV
ncbi:MAG: hypothetical protein CML24_01135 [Rhizobiales bacterium]|nr:hypothetical protein [Hyphomicrobiales bacterium]